MKNNTFSQHHAGRWFGRGYVNTVQKANSMRVKLFCLLTSAMAMTPTHLTAQVFTTLYSFPAADPNSYANAAGAFPMGELILSGNTL
jgi:hypothetical protein